MGLAKRDTAYHTYGDYLGWQEDVRYELIDGTAYQMPSASTVRHQQVTGEVYYQIANALDGKPCRVLLGPVDVLLPKADEADARVDTVVQPDVLVVCDDAKVGERRVRGAPDFVVEVLSPSTAGHDMVLKRRIYERSGVREYWLIHPTDRVLTVYRLEGTEFGKPDTQELKGETPISALPGVSIEWDRLAARLPPPEY